METFRILSEGEEIMDQWQMLRLKVLERDQYLCQRCFNEDKKVEIHHIVPRRSGGQDTLENLITYCRKCYKIIEPAQVMRTVPIISKIMLMLKVSDKNHTRFMRLKQYPMTQDDFIEELLTLYERKGKGVKRK